MTRHPPPQPAIGPTVGPAAGPNTPHTTGRPAGRVTRLADHRTNRPAGPAGAGTPSDGSAADPASVIPLPRRPDPTESTDPAGPSSRDCGVPGDVGAGGTWPMARYLTDPATEAEIQALAAEAGPMTVDQAARLARLLRINRRAERGSHDAAGRPAA
jgi:hypothetical protein